MLFGPSKSRVLVADDDELFRSLLCEALSREYEVLEAENGKEAVDLALARKPDLVLLDIDMPLMNGLKVVAVLRADRRTKTVPIIMCTARGELEFVETLLKAGANDYTVKPVDMPGLLTKVRNLLARKRAA